MSPTARPLIFKKRDSVLKNLEDVFDGEDYLGWIAPAPHGRFGRDWWHYQAFDASGIAAGQKTTKGRFGAIAGLKDARRGR